ncbi:MAG: SGNH/GDSL hydrolase family protein [Candidatus Omnitrophica bacterium]|nr:SGNH/GDSL hydrolase family protein [Candidatus Omnitrophota bacterium]
MQTIHQENQTPETAAAERQRKKFNILALVFSALFSFFFFEMSYRVYLFGPSSLLPHIMNSIHPIDSKLLEPVPGERVWQLKPNLDIYFKKVKVKTNSQGLFDQEYSIDKDPNTFRVAVVGDSFTMPDGVEIEKAFHSLLETRLNQESTGEKYEFINFAAAMYSFRQYVAVINERALAYKPDMILIGFCSENDYRPYPEKLYREIYKPRSTTRPFTYLYTVEKITGILKGRIKSPDYAKKAERQSRNTATGPKPKRYMKEMFSRLERISRENKIPIVVVNLQTWPTPENLTGYLEELALTHGIYFVDLSFLLPREKTRQYQIYRADGHPNAKAHKIFADALYQYLKNKQLITQKG